MSFLSRAKDRIIEPAALAYLNKKLLAPYGRATELRLDSRAKQIFLQLELNGETSVIDIELTDYVIRQEGERYFAELNHVRTSREWLTALTRQFLRKPMEIPPEIGRWLTQIL